MEIDSLNIQISADANSANKALNGLVNNVSKLSNVLGNINLTGISSFSNEIKNISSISTGIFVSLLDKVKSFGNIDAEKIKSAGDSLKTLAGGLNTISESYFNAESLNGINSAFNKFGSIKGTAGVDNLLKIKDSLSQFLTEMNKIGSLTFDTTNLSNLITSVSKLGNKSAASAAANLPILTKELESLMKTLSRAPKVSDNVIRMTNALARLARTGASSGRAAKSLSQSFNNYSLSTIRAGNATKKFHVSLAGLAAKIGSILIALRGLKKAIDISSSLTEVQNVVDVTFGDMKRKVEDLASVSIQDFGMSELTAKQIASRFQAMGVAMGFSQTKMSDMSIRLTKLAADMSSFYNVAQEDAAKSLQSIFTGESEPLRRYGLDLSQATLKEWALNNGLNANIQAMSQAEKAMLRYQYVLANTGAAQGDFARTSGTWANQLRILTQNFQALGGIIGGVLINAFKPFVSALNSAMQSVISFAKTVANALGAIFGWTIEINPGGVASDFEAAGAGAKAMEEGTAGAAKNLKGMNKYIAPWQEVNNMTSSGSDGGGGGGAGAGDAGGGVADAAQANLVRVETIFDKYKSEIDSLYGLGKYIGDALSRAMESINWKSVYEKARNFGAGLAQFLNGLISPRLFGNIGKTIAGALNTALHFLDSFGETFDWKNFGLSIAAGINNFFETFDFGLLAHTLNTWANGILDTAIAALDNTDWGMIGEKIGTFLAEIDILKIAGKLGRAIRKTISSAFEIFLGSLKIAPIETLLSSIIVIPNILKAIISSKIITGIAKIAGKFAAFGNGAILTARAAGGNQIAIATLAVQYPKLGKAVEVARKAFANFRFGIENGNFLTGLNEGLSTIRNNLTGVQKGVITAVAGFAEFDIVSDAFQGIVDGSENLVAGIAKIGGAVSVAAAAMYTALGPAGLAISGITGTIAAIKGINDAFDTIRAEEIGNTIKNAMTTPGGVPLSEITSGFAAKLSEAASGFDTIKDKSDEMDSVQKNIENTWVEIYKIQEAMQNGVMSVDEGKQELERLFGELAALTEQKFSTMNTVIMSAYGEGGSFRKALENIGADTETAIDTMITYGYLNSEKAKEIAEELAGMNIGDEGYAEKIAQLQSLTGEMSGFAKAASDFTYDMNSLQGKIDYSEIFLEDGSIDTEALKSYLSEATTALSDYEKSLDEAGKEISQYWEDIINSTTATEEQKAAAQSQLDYIPQAISTMKADAELEIVSFTDMLQNDFISRTNQIIDDEISNWNQKSAVEKWWNGVWGAGTESEYVKEAVDQQQANIDELSEVIESSLSDLETDGVTWASDAAKEIYDALFDSEYIYSEMGAGHYKYTLNKNYKDIINEATEGISGLAADRGKDATDGYASGFSDSANIQNAQNQAKTFTEKVLETIAKTQDSHSPSKVTEGYGKDAVDGYNLGITRNQESSLMAVSSYTNNIIKKLSEIVEPIKQIGIDAMRGLYNGLSSMEQPLYNKAENIADGITKTIKTALDIHSPSKVMFKLGSYTLQGFSDGIKSEMEESNSIIKNWASGMADNINAASRIGGSFNSFVPADFTPVTLDVNYSGKYQPSDISADIQEQIDVQMATYMYEVRRQNELLEQQNALLERIYDKTGITEGEIFNAARKGVKSFQNRTKKNPWPVLA